MGEAMTDYLDPDGHPELSHCVFGTEDEGWGFLHHEGRQRGTHLGGTQDGGH